MSAADRHTGFVVSSLDQAMDLRLILPDCPVHALSYPLGLPDGSVIVGVYSEDLAQQYPYVCLHLPKREMVELFQRHYPLEVPQIIVHGLKEWLKFFSTPEGPTFDSPNFRCTRLLAYLCDPPEKSEDESEKDLTLEALVRRYCGGEYPLWGIWLRGRAYPEGFYRRLWEDAYFTYVLWHRLLDEWAPDENPRLFELYGDIELPMVRILLQMELQGIRVDEAHARMELETVRAHLAVLRNEISESVGSWLNPNSHKQVRPFFSWLLEQSYTGSLDDDAFEALLDRHPAIRPMLEYRKATRTETFLDKVAQAENGRLYPTYHQCRVATGRISATDPAVQGIARDLRERYLLPEPGHHLVEADYKAAEARILAYFSSDLYLWEILGDESRYVFTVVAEYFNEVFEEQNLTLSRDQGKTIFYAVAYGVSAPNLAARLGVTDDVAAWIISEFKYRLFYQVGQFICRLRERLVRMGRKGRFLQTAWGRRRMFDRRLISLHDPERPIRKDPVRDPEVRRAFNFLLQGTVSDLIKQAQISIDKAFRQQHMRSRVILNLHDGLYLSVPPDEYDVMEHIVREAMESQEFIARIQSDTCPWVEVPLRTEVKIIQYRAAD